MIKLIPIFSFFSILLFSCKNNLIEDVLLNKNSTIEQKIETVLSQDFFTELGLSEAHRVYLNEFYGNRKYKPLWTEDTVLTLQGQKLKRILENPILLGLPSKRYLEFVGKTNFLENELIITCFLSEVNQDLKYGMIDTVTNIIKSKKFTPVKELSKKLKFKTKEIEREIIAWGPSDSTYLKLANALFDFVSKYPLNDQRSEIETTKTDSILAVQQVKAILSEKGYFENSEITDSLYLNRIFYFQKQNGLKDDAVIGEHTIHALKETNLQKCKRASLALEKWRWKNNEIQDSVISNKLVWINIPEYKLRFYVDKKLKSEHRIIVGTTKNQTPEFRSNMNRIVVFPYWNVPYSISSKEILPSLKNNVNYLEKNNMRVFKNQDEIDPSTIDWNSVKEKSFPYRIRQEPGNSNSLGILKFEFANKHSVYVHDTPTKRLFNNSIRSYSHGCIRCENPVELAKIILDFDKNKLISDSLDVMLERKKNKVIHLRNSIPVHIEYISVVPSIETGLIFYKDIYGLDEKYVSLIFN
jgi:L,D-transpeptidase YcbB